MLIGRGLVEGARVIHKFGEIADVGTAFVAVTTAGAYPTPKTASPLEVVSSSTDDNGTTSPLGVGALCVEVTGIKDWDTGEEVISFDLDGITPVAIGSWLRVYRMKVCESGAYADDQASSHNSTITVRDLGGAGLNWAIIDSSNGFGFGQSEIAIYSLPAGKVAYVQSAEIFVETSKAADVVFFARQEADVITPPYSSTQAKIVLKNIAGLITTFPSAPIGPFVGPCDMGWIGRATAQTANIQIAFEIYEYDA
jgi:hypothetical protein